MSSLTRHLFSPNKSFVRLDKAYIKCRRCMQQGRCMQDVACNVPTHNAMGNAPKFFRNHCYCIYRFLYICVNKKLIQLFVSNYMKCRIVGTLHATSLHNAAMGNVPTWNAAMGNVPTHNAATGNVPAWNVPTCNG